MSLHIELLQYIIEHCDIRTRARFILTCRDLCYESSNRKFLKQCSISMRVYAEIRQHKYVVRHGVGTRTYGLRKVGYFNCEYLEDGTTTKLHVITYNIGTASSTVIFDTFYHRERECVVESRHTHA
jgi:hypothetical protein